MYLLGRSHIHNVLFLNLNDLYGVYQFLTRVLPLCFWEGCVTSQGGFLCPKSPSTWYRFQEFHNWCMYATGPTNKSFWSFCEKKFDYLLSNVYKMKVRNVNMPLKTQNVLTILIKKKIIMSKLKSFLK
jgi:hypothetical protein